MKIHLSYLSAFLLLLLILFISPLIAQADTGPKPSVVISFKNLDSAECYGTLLSKSSSTGPAQAWDGDEDNIYLSGVTREIWQAFQDYPDADGYYFLQRIWKVSDEGKINWGYFPPNDFKVLLYYPEGSVYLESAQLKRYAFDSYFTFDMNDVDITSGTLSPAKEKYDYGSEIIALLARIILTIALELVLALLFGLREKKELLLIASVNLATQVILNVLLNVIAHFEGILFTIIAYVFLEIMVIAIELATYVFFLPKRSTKPVAKKTIIIYAVVANLVTFLMGIMLAIFVPSLFIF